MQPQRRIYFGNECGNVGSGPADENQVAGEKARGKKCDVRFSLTGEHKVFQKNMRTGVRTLLRTGLVPARSWRGQAVDIAPAERLKMRRQMAAEAGKEAVSL